MQKPGIFKILVHSIPEAFSEPCQTSTMGRLAKIVKGYNNVRNISFSRSLLCKMNLNFFNAFLFFTPKVCQT